MRKLNLIAIAVMLLAAIPVHAGTATIDTSASGHLRIEYANDLDGNEPIEGATFSLYKVAEINKDGSYASDIPEFSGETEAKDVDIQGMSPTTTMTTGPNGVAEEDVDQGVYLVTEDNPTENHDSAEPTLISLPYTTEEDGWVYELTISPKANPLKTTPTVTPAAKNTVTKEESTTTGANIAKTGDLNRLYPYALIVLAVIVIIAASKRRKAS